MKRMMMTLYVLLAAAFGAARGAEEEWIRLFDGKTFAGWRASEHTNSWTIEGDALVCHGPRSHLFYVGPEAPFRDFVLQVEVMTTPGSNAGIYFHTRFQETGWPKHGFEAQVNNSHSDPKRTGSLYGIVNVTEAPAKDGEWFTQEVAVKGKTVTIKVNGKLLVEYTEPPESKPGTDFARVLDEGTVALQAHDPKSKVYFRNIRIRKLGNQS